MNNLQSAATLYRPVVIGSIFGNPGKKWINVTEIQALDPASWLNRHQSGTETHFRSGYSCHWFKISFPMVDSVDNRYDSFHRIALKFRTVDNAKVTHIELYNGPVMCWEYQGRGLQGNYTYSMGPENCWDIDSARNITHSLSIVLSVEFGTPKQYVPEFTFFSAWALVSGGDYLSKADKFNQPVIAWLNVSD